MLDPNADEIPGSALPMLLDTRRLTMTRYRRIRVEGATYFFTVVTAARQPLLIEHLDALRLAFGRSRALYPFTLDALVVLPDHLHTIWTLPPGDDNNSVRWSILKRTFSAAMPLQTRTISQRTKRERGVWQRRFWEHLIRDEKDLRAHIDYIHFNPVKHGLCDSPEDWPYSSYRRVARDGPEPDWHALAALAGEWD